MRDPRGRARNLRGALAIAVAVLVASACRRAPERPVPEVTLYASVGALPVQVISTAVAQRGMARLRLVERLSDAEVVWAGDPTEVLAAAEVIAVGEAPVLGDVQANFQDPERRFAPLGARARVLVVNPRATLPLQPRNLRDLADPRLAGRIALPPAKDAAQLTWLAVLASVHGEASVLRFLDSLDRNRPHRAASDADVTALVGRGGDVAVGLTGSEAGAAAAISAAGLEVVYPDQGGRGAVVVPTAVASTRQGVTRPETRAVLEYLVGSDAERLLVARVPGFMPLRPDVPLPPGVRPAGNLVTVRLDWDRILLERKKWLERLAR